MTREELKNLLLDTYSQTVDDNMKDFQELFIKITALASMLVYKGIITKDEMNELLSISSDNFKDILNNKEEEKDEQNVVQSQDNSN